MLLMHLAATQTAGVGGAEARPVRAVATSAGPAAGRDC